MKINYPLIVLVSLVVLLSSGRQSDAKDAIEVFCWDLTPQAKAVLSGLERVLGQTLPVAEAAGNYDHGEVLLKELAQKQPRLIIVLGTQALSLTAPKIKKGLVVFAMVADPYHTGAAYNKDHPDDHHENIVGIASPPPLEEAIQKAGQFFPAKRHWGLLYDPSEGPSVELKQNFAALAQSAGLKLTALAAGTGAEAIAALNELRRQGVQVIFVPPDQFSKNYAQHLMTLGLERRFLVVNGNPRLDRRGAVLSVTLNYETIGEQAAQLVQRVLNGEKTGAIPIIQASPAQVEVDESLLTSWAGYPPGKN
jgi:putative tryptophan/tyrosine transport system substrate-binding protein